MMKSCESSFAMDFVKFEANAAQNDKKARSTFFKCTFSRWSLF